MRRFVWIAVSAGALTWMSSAAAQDAGAMPQSDKSTLLSALSSRIDNVSGHDSVPWASANGKGTYDLNPVMSSTQGAPCSSISTCDSPCRSITYTYVGRTTQGAIVNDEYSGRLCRLSSGSWRFESDNRRSRDVLQVSASNRTPPAVDPAAVAPTDPAAVDYSADISAIQSKLRALLYYRAEPDGVWSGNLERSIRRFLQDERLQDQSVSQAAAALTQINVALDRATARHQRSSSCAPTIPTNRFVACATSAAR